MGRRTKAVLVVHRTDETRDERTVKFGSGVVNERARAAGA
jgi:hypothetical protein